MPQEASRKIVQGSWLGVGRVVYWSETDLTLSSPDYQISIHEGFRAAESTFLKLVYMSSVINRLIKTHTSFTLMELKI